MKRLVTTVQIRNNPTSVPPLELILKTNGKTFRGIAVAGMFLIASGGAPGYTYTASGLPTGLSLNAGTGEITGVPATIGHNVITATATDSSTNPITQDFTIDVSSRLVVKDGTPPEAETLFAYGGYDFTVSNATGAVTWTITGGALPTGLSLSSGGHLSGTATATGTFNAVATATDAGTGDTLDVPFSMFVEIGFHFTSLNVHGYTLIVGVPFVATQNGYLNGVAPFASAIFGSWPVGLSATFDTNTHSVTYLAKQAFSRQNVQFNTADALGNTPAFHGTSSLEAIDPNKEIIMRDGFGDVGDPNPATITIKSTDGSVGIDTSASSGNDTVYDLSTGGDSSGGGTGGASIAKMRAIAALRAY